MAKPRKTKDPHIQLFHEVIEGIAYAKLKPTEWQFIMVLWRLTYGRKNMTGQDGQWTPWVNAEFHRRTGLNRDQVSRVYASLLKKKVIKKRKGMIGFNKHFHLWFKQTLLSKRTILSKQTLLSKQTIDQTDNKVLSKQTTTIDQTDNTNAPQVLASDDPQLLKKERKKETIQTTSKYSKEFNIFWGKYPKANDNKKAAYKAWEKHFTKDGSFTLDEILKVLTIDMLGVFNDASENKFLPGAGPWLNRERWEDLKVSPEDGRKEEYKKKLARLNFRRQADPDYTKEMLEYDKQQLINTYKEIQ